MFKPLLSVSTHFPQHPVVHYNGTSERGRSVATHSPSVATHSAWTIERASRLQRAWHCEIVTWAMKQLGCPVNWLGRSKHRPQTYIAAGIAAASSGQFTALQKIRFLLFGMLLFDYGHGCRMTQCLFHF